MISEIFISIQGEGKKQGTLSLFIRFQGCNLRCKWCDTKYCSFPEHYNNSLSLEKALEKIKGLIKNKKIKNIVFTGGEPLLFQDEIVFLIKKIKEISKKEKLKANLEFEIETNGTIELKKEFIPLLTKNDIFFNISPKPGHSQIKGFENKTFPKLIEQLMKLEEEMKKELFIVKFIVNNKKDKEFVFETIKKFEISNNKVFIQANCTDKEECLKKGKELIEFCLENNFNFSSRLHLIFELK
ncbi:MAG: 7-carboxy-7-deazaguanine synthase QueE [Nanoarchaeota archaeon]